MSEEEFGVIKNKPSRKPHKYYPGVLVTNNAPTKIRVKQFYDPKLGIWKVIINLKR